VKSLKRSIKLNLIQIYEAGSNHLRQAVHSDIHHVFDCGGHLPIVGSLWVVASDASDMILSIAWRINSLAVMPIDSATALSLTSFCDSSGKVIVIWRFFFPGNASNGVYQSYLCRKRPDVK
jgi:hypothetical protein